MQDRRSHRPSELSGGQQQRVAIARALVSRPTVVFADEPTGNLDSKTGGEILELLRSSVQEYGQTLVMVTHDARAAATADRILFLADGEIVKELGADADEHAVLRAIEEIAPNVIKVALRGMAGRKLRATLTAIAIVLGVAMMSGAYVLTDTIDKAFDTIFVESYAGTDAVVTGKDAGISFEGESAQAPPIPEETLEQVRPSTASRSPPARVLDFQTKLLRPDGDAIDTGGAPAFAFGIETGPEYDRFNPLNLVEGRWPSGDGEVVVDEGVAEEENLQTRRPDRSRRGRPRSSSSRSSGSPSTAT